MNRVDFIDHMSSFYLVSPFISHLLFYQSLVLSIKLQFPILLHQKKILNFESTLTLYRLFCC